MKTNFKIAINDAVEMEMDTYTHNLIEGKEFIWTDISNFITKTLIDANINGVLKPKIAFSRGESMENRRMMGIYVFLETTSSDVEQVEIPEKLRELIDTPYKPSEKLYNTMKIFCAPDDCKYIRKHTSMNGKNVLYFKCDVSKTLCKFIESK